jgi:hypothetical protein
MQDEVYSDGIGEITITGPIVRIDLVTLSPSERDASNNPKPVLRQRIIMPVDAFANAVDLMQKAMNGLVESGTVSRRPTDASSASDSTDPRQQALGPRNWSPNFS